MAGAIPQIAPLPGALAVPLSKLYPKRHRPGSTQLGLLPRSLCWGCHRARYHSQCDSPAAQQPCQHAHTAVEQPHLGSSCSAHTPSTCSVLRQLAHHRVYTLEAADTGAHCIRRSTTALHTGNGRCALLADSSSCQRWCQQLRLHTQRPARRGRPAAATVKATRATSVCMVQRPQVQKQ